MADVIAENGKEFLLKNKTYICVVVNEYNQCRGCAFDAHQEINCVDSRVIPMCIAGLNKDRNSYIFVEKTDKLKGNQNEVI